MEKKEVTIPVFDGENYHMWKKRIEIFLKLKEFNVVISREKAATDKEEWDKLDLKAMNLIYNCISDKQLE